MPESLTFKLECVVKAKQEVMEDFEGPLDLILELLRREKIEICDLRISLLTEQYLAWMALRRRLDLEVASEFVAMASHLVYLKTKTLLAVGQRRDEEMDELMLALRERERREEYRRILVARAFLELRANIGRDIIAKPPENLAPAAAYTHTHEISALLAAMADIGLRALHKAPPPVEVFSQIITPEKYPVQEKMAHIMRELAGSAKASLQSVLRSQSRSESIALFLAVLELCRSYAVLITEEEGRLYLVKADAA
ncbi:MAG: segregation/condensation protein A [Oscillospiraceae bacterium]|jgi:segregation and condensation protein A|nr:segregation/condensation protein A [Oscillospiraceae bacterium]